MDPVVVSGVWRHEGVASWARRRDDPGEQRVPLRLAVGRREVVINDRYETLSIANEVLIALFFAAGSILFFSEETETVGVWLSALGSLSSRFGLRSASRGEPISGGSARTPTPSSPHRTTGHSPSAQG